MGERESTPVQESITGGKKERNIRAEHISIVMNSETSHLSTMSRETRPGSRWRTKIPKLDSTIHFTRSHRVNVSFRNLGMQYPTLMPGQNIRHPRDPPVSPPASGRKKRRTVDTHCVEKHEYQKVSRNHHCTQPQQSNCGCYWVDESGRRVE